MSLSVPNSAGSSGLKLSQNGTNHITVIMSLDYTTPAAEAVSVHVHLLLTLRFARTPRAIWLFWGHIFSTADSRHLYSYHNFFVRTIASAHFSLVFIFDWSDWSTSPSPHCIHHNTPSTGAFGVFVVLICCFVSLFLCVFSDL